MRWYDKGHRDLPWRRTRDPYRVWVSEIMCQQTRVDTVIPYYERFIASFPTPTALADADEDAVMSHWSGLGYYRRARMLHAGAKDVVARYGGEVPSGADERLSLPGVGRYTAGAIGSIAFEREEAIVDGNVARVLSRVHRISHELQSTASNKALWVHAEALVRGKRPGDLNQSLMELGALVCTPTSPKCGECPIAKG
ncbi:MAG: A/G-specific adenine glycosylase, partial [Polyangiales bacterium]